MNWKEGIKTGFAIGIGLVLGSILVYAVIFGVLYLVIPEEELNNPSESCICPDCNALEIDYTALLEKNNEFIYLKNGEYLTYPLEEGEFVRYEKGEFVRYFYNIANFCRYQNKTYKIEKNDVLLFDDEPYDVSDDVKNCLN